MQSPRRQLVWFFLLTFILSWAIWVPAMTASFGWAGYQVPAFGLVGAIMPGIAALIVTAFASGRRGVGALFGQLRVWRVDARWYAFVLLAWPAIIAAVFVVCSLWQGSPLPTGDFSIGLLLMMILIQTPNTLMEEIGWRGFALPRMAPLQGWLPASLTLGVIWATWHLPYWTSSPTTPVYGVLSLVLPFIMVVAGSVVFAWVYMNTRSVLLVWLMHLTTNTTSAFLPLSSEDIGSLWPFALYTLAVVLVAIFAGRSLLRAGRTTEPTPAGSQGSLVQA